MTPHRQRPQPTTQSGFILMTSLIFLTVITLIAVSAIRSSTLQERMASNQRDSSQARQAADAALRQGEFRLEAPRFDTYQPPAICGADNDDCSQPTKDLRIWTERAMLSANAIDDATAFLDPTIWAPARAYTGVPALPVRFFVEEMHSNFQPRNLDPDTAAHADGGVIYRVTAHAKGQNPAAVAVTQSLYEKHY